MNWLAVLNIFGGFLLGANPIEPEHILLEILAPYYIGHP